jgi:hypothetical protein
MTTKANSTVSLKTSQGDVRVKEGTLVLIINDKYLPEIGMIGKNAVHPLFMWTQAHKDGFKNLVEYHKTAVVQPIIISTKDRIEIGDKIYHKADGKVITYTKEIAADKALNNPSTYGYYKVLVLPEQFSSKQLQAIVDGKMKEDDQVYVQCKRVGYQHMSADFVELDSFNHATLHKIERKLYTKEEVDKIIEQQRSIAFAKFLHHTDLSSEDANNMAYPKY